MAIDYQKMAVHLHWRTGFVSALQGYKFDEPGQSADRLMPILSHLVGISGSFQEPDSAAAKVIEYLIQGTIEMCRWAQGILAVDPLATTHREAARAHGTITLQAATNLPFPSLATVAQRAGNLLRTGETIDAVSQLFLELQAMPVPLFLREGSRFVPHPRSEPPPQREGPFIVKLSLQIDGRPLVSPQLVQANILYDLRAEIHVPDWPEAADRLEVDFVSTAAPGTFVLSPFLCDRSALTGGDLFTIVGTASFPMAQSVLSEPLSIALRARFVARNGEEIAPATIIGYHQIQVRVSDASRTPILSHYRSIDERIDEIMHQVDIELPGLNPDHRHDFINVLATVTNYLGQNLQHAVFREGAKVHEADFQRDLLRHMRSSLGEEVQEAPRQGGGPTDIQYRTVTTELKVEDKISDRRTLIQKYLSQPTAYSSGGGAQLGVLCILDLTERQVPPANPKNSITLETPALHGFPLNSAPYPTRIAAIIIDGNLRHPSSYSSGHPRGKSS